MKLKLLVLAIIAAVISSCGGDGKKSEKVAPKEEVIEVVAVEEIDPMQNKGIGPIKNITLDAINEGKVAEGKVLFKSKCSACHKMSKRFVGPGLAGVTERRSPEWIMNMILNPEVMVSEDPIAKDLLATYMSPMANQSLTEDEARLILEYFRTVPAKQ
jgi:mono/diheme cytochrome c family protein